MRGSGTRLARGAGTLAAALGLTVAALAASPPAAGSGAPCAPPNAADPMPEGAGHDHANASQHAFSCRLDLVASDDALGLVPEPMMFGELDVAGDRLVMATAWPEGGFLVYDVADASSPVPLARFQGPRCEEVLSDIDCGADVKLSSDGKLAFLATQAFYRVPGPYRDPAELAHPTEPGITVVDLEALPVPAPTFFLPVEPMGVHMLAYHEIGGAGYVFAIQNLVGVQISRVVRAPAGAALVPVATIVSDGHDVSLYDDPVDGKTYLSLSAGSQGLRIYDVTNPQSPRLAGTWAPPGGGWYTHSATMLRWGAKRFVLVAPEQWAGQHGGVPGVVWLVNATTIASPSLAGSWSNPGGHAAGNIRFSPHNFVYRDGVTHSANYHGGVWALDWSAVLSGSATRPVEVGYHVPHARTRPFVAPLSLSRFLTGFDILTRPSVWDVAGKDGYVFASDINGGLSVLQPAG